MDNYLRGIGLGHENSKDKIARTSKLVSGPSARAGRMRVHYPHYLTGQFLPHFVRQRRLLPESQKGSTIWDCVSFQTDG